MIETNKELLFVGGDLSGIQKFIYNISSKKAMVSLKGRSAYLRSYTDELCQGIMDLDSIKNCRTKEIIYCDGGKFYLIIEDSLETREAIGNYYSAKEELLWQEHRGQLGLAIAYVPFILEEDGGIIVDEVHYDKIGELWSRITSLFNQQKNRKFNNLLKDKYDTFFEVIPEGGETKICAITGIEDKKCVKLEEDDDGEAIWVLPTVRKQVEIGKKLRDIEGFKTLEEYAMESYIGVLRMDVDGLGARFIKGFSSFKEYSFFSNSLSTFFHSKLSDLQKDYKDFLNIVYAGGDDLFVVGRWDKVIDFAADTHDKFCKHMSEDPVTISGGMAIVGAKFPIAKSAVISGNAEEDAKKYQNGKKNAFSFLGECVNWDNEFVWVRRMKDEFVHHINDNGVSRGLLHQMMLYAEMADEGKDPSYKWHEAYYLSRMVERIVDKNDEAKEFLRRLRKEGFTRTRKQYRLLSLSARWAELTLRMKDNNN